MADYRQKVQIRPLLDKAINVTGTLGNTVLTKFGLKLKDVSPVFEAKRRPSEIDNIVNFSRK